MKTANKKLVLDFILKNRRIEFVFDLERFGQDEIDDLREAIQHFGVCTMKFGVMAYAEDEDVGYVSPISMCDVVPLDDVKEMEE